MRLKRLTALLLSLVMSLSLVSALAEDVVLTAEQEAEIRALDEEVEADTVWVPVGPVYWEPTLDDFDLDSPAIYTCTIMANHSLFAQTYEKAADASTTPKTMVKQGYDIKGEVLYVGQKWAIVRAKKAIGYIKRDYIENVKPLDTKNTPPYGVQKPAYVAVTADTCPVRKSMSEEEESFVVLNPGTVITIWKIQDGWGIVPYWRTFGYIDMSQLKDLIPVAVTDEPLREDAPIAAYTSYYNMAQTEVNLGRITNIRVACARLTRVMEQGESLNFNTDVGPYEKRLGYQPAPVLVSGTTKNNYGGGTCQVSSTLYNALIQLDGIRITQQRPHGPAGASYLPHGVDAAVGSTTQNLQFRNNCGYSIRVEGHTSDDGALTMLIYRVD